MGKKKVKPTKKSRKRVSKEDVKYSTSLPPDVEGQLRCFMRVSITKIDWMVAKPPDVAHVKLQWWGEVADGTVFRPLDMQNPQKSTARTTARFPVRCGPKQFTAYLNDMGILVLSILKGTAMTPVGKVEINEIGHLAPQIPINGFFPVFSNKDHTKIAELHVSMAFEPLPTSYDSSSSMPTTDISLATGSVATESSFKRQHPRPSVSDHQPELYSSRKVLSSDDGAHLVSPVKQPLFDGNRRIPTPRGVDSDYSFVIGPGADRTTSSQLTQGPSMSKSIPETADDSVTTHTSYHQNACKGFQQPTRSIIQDKMSGNIVATNSRQQHQISPVSKTGQDLIKALLDRGTKLRDAMVVSEVAPREKRKTENSSDYGITTSAPEKGSNRLRKSSSGELFREILDVDDKEQMLSTLQFLDKEESLNAEVHAVELLVGDKILKKELNNLKALQASTSPVSSVSSHSDGDISEPEDPIHDTSILEDLFYKGLRSSSDDNLNNLLSSDSEEEKEKGKFKKRKKRSITPDINDPGNIRPVSRRSSSSRHESVSTTPPTSDRPRAEPERKCSDIESSSAVNHINRGSKEVELFSDSERMSDGSHVSFDGPQEEQINVLPSDGLSVERLTLLGKVHIARVMVDTLSLEVNHDTPVDTTNVRSNRASRLRGKPPRPASKVKKKSYFVEYQFPVVASSCDRSLVNTMATEVMRLVSKKITDSGAYFGHRSVFPVSFNGTAVDRWWKQMVVFKVYSRTPGQKTPTYLGVSHICLREVLQSLDLIIHQELPVKEKCLSSQSHSQSSRSSEEDNTVRDTAPIIGKLKVTIELGSDNRDFSMALARTKLAEMRGAKIVPLPSNQPKLPLKIPTNSANVVPLVKQKQQITSQGMQTELDQSETVNSKILLDAQKETNSRSCFDKQKFTAGSEMDHKRQSGKGVFIGQDEDGVGCSTRQGQCVGGTETVAVHEGLTLHSLLLIPEGRGITMQRVTPVVKSDKHPQQRPHSTAQVSAGWAGWGQDRNRATRNTYLVCRMFWSEDSVRSNVCWGTSEPNYNFIQVAPVLLNPSLLERTRNNVMVIEVWDKKTSAQNDQLVGIVKVSLHQFYMSFRDRRIANTLLKSQYPVVAVDNCIDITDPFSGVQYGQIKVLLALGSMEQISALQRLKCDKDVITDVRPERPVHYLERGECTSENRDTSNNRDDVVEHVFEVVVEGVRGMTQLDDSYWGEADCFVQYHFPSQTQEQAATRGQPTQAGAPILRPHRTATTLCVPDPTFHDVTRHRIVLPHGIPAQRELLTACAGVGGGVGGIPFEVWCRYYYPNIRDQVAAKALLPLAKLCAMVTMQRRGEPSVQTFSLPLKLQHIEGDDLTPEQKAKSQDAGLLDVTISYKTAVVRQSTRDTSASTTGGPHVCLSVGVLRACGLKMTANHLAQFNTGMQYASEVGVNAYVKMELSFLAKEEMRISQTIARSFAPEFSHYVDFPSPLLLSDGENDTVSLAEALESAEMRLQVWHQTPGFRPVHNSDYKQLDLGTAATVSGRKLVPGSVDVLLGTAAIPLHSLLIHRTGVQGWVPLTIPSQGWAANHTDAQTSSPPNATNKTTTHRGLERIGGGLELTIKFAHPNDRERIINAARSVGWSPQEIVDDVEIWEEDEDVSRLVTAEVTVHTDAAWFSDYTAHRPGQDTMNPQAKAYIRYKFYDKAAVCSKLCCLDISEDGHITADFKHAQCFQAAHTQPFTWYLREEKLEIQLWVSYNQDHPGQDHPGQDQPRPRHRDKLIGCAYVDLSPLTDKKSKHHRVSGLYPLFKPGASNLGGACIRVHIKMETSHRKENLQKDVGPTDHIRTPGIGEQPHNIDRTGLGQRHAGLDKQILVQEWLEDEQAQEIERQRKARVEEESKKAEEDAPRNKPVMMKVLVERAMHLPCIQDANGLQISPSCYVTFQSAGKSSTVQSSTIPDSVHPNWGFEADIKVSKDILDNQIWQQTASSPDMNSDRVLGFCSIDMGPLLAGFRSLNGWYNIMDFNGQCHGQIKVCITPSESLSPLKQSPQQRILTMTPNSSTLFIPGVSYVIPHPAPANSSQHMERNPGMSSSDSPLTETQQSHFQEHLKNIRKFHQDLQKKMKHHLPDPAIEQRSDERKVEEKRNMHFPEPSTSSVTSSFLVQDLRKNLQELDRVHQKLQQRLSTSDVPVTKSPEDSHFETSPLERRHGQNLHLGCDNNNGNISSESNLFVIGRTRNGNTYQRGGSIEDSNVQDIAKGTMPSEEQNEDISDSVVERSPSELSEEWGDSIKFCDNQQEMVSHQYKDTSDVVVPKALNDVSLAKFGNDFTTDFQPMNSDSTNDPLILRLGERTNQLPGEKMYDEDQVDDLIFVSGGGKMLHDISKQNSDGSAEHMRTDTQGQSKSLNDSHESDDSIDDNRLALQEQHDIRATYSGSISLDSNPLSKSNTDRTEILFDATNHQYLSGVNPADKLTAKTFASPTNLLSAKNQDTSKEDSQGDSPTTKCPSEPKILFFSKHSSDLSVTPTNTNNSFKHIQDLATDTCTLPRPVPDEQSLLQTRNQSEGSQTCEMDEEISKRHRSLSWSSDDSVILSLEPKIALRQQKYVKEKTHSNSAKVPAALSQAPMPNFFLPPQDLEASMRALHNAVTFLPRSQPREDTSADAEPSSNLHQKSQGLATRLSGASTISTHQPIERGFGLTKKTKHKTPSAEEAKRIAKIFGSKYSMPI